MGFVSHRKSRVETIRSASRVNTKLKGKLKAMPKSLERTEAMIRALLVYGRIIRSPAAEVAMISLGDQGGCGNSWCLERELFSLPRKPVTSKRSSFAGELNL